MIDDAVNARRAQALREDGWATDDIAAELGLTNEQILDLLALRRRCACPCNELFVPSHQRQAYINRNHAQAAYRQRVKSTARAHGVPDHLNLQTAKGTRHRNGDAQKRRAPDMRLSYTKVRDAIAHYFGDPVVDGRSYRADQILQPLLTARQRRHLEATR